MKEIQIEGCISIPASVSIDAFNDRFIEWVEANGWMFGGGITELDENGEAV